MIQILQIGLGTYPGGVENCILNYYRHFDRSRFAFDFVDIYGDGLPYSDDILKLGGEIHTLKNYKRHPLKSAVQLQNLLKQNQYDIIHINMRSAANPIPVWVSCNCKSKPIVIAHSHNSDVPSGKLRRIMNAANIGKLREMPVEKWACSIKAGKWMWGESFDAANVIPNAIDVSRFQRNPSMRERLHEKCDFQELDNVVGFVGRLHEQKNVLFLPEILDELRKRSPNYKMLIVGDGDLRSSLADKFERLGLLPYVYFVGACEDASPWYSAMDVFVLPSIFEGLPVVGVEAQACTLPCFVSNRITEELNITGAVKYLPIDKGAKIWADAIHFAFQNLISKTYEFPKEYQIICAARLLENRYSTLLQKRQKSVQRSKMR